MKVCRLCRRYAKGGASQCSFDGGELLDAPLPPMAPGDSLGRYEVSKALAAGQTGVLLLCKDLGTEDHDEMVVKVFNRTSESIDARRAILESVSAVATAGLQPIDDVFEHDERLCSTQTFMEGTTLSATLPKTGPLDPEEAIALGRRLCEVLTIVHESGLAHYDIRPGHLFIPEGASPREAVLFDLGSPSPPGRLSPPEVYDGFTDLTKTDIHGLCVTLYVCLAGRSPFRTDTAEELSWLIHNAPPPPLRVVRKTGGVDPSLERLITWGMAKDPEDRPTLEQVADALEGMATGDHDQVDQTLASADTTSRVELKRIIRASSSPSTSPRPRLRPETSSTLKFVKKILPKGVLNSTGLTQAFYVEGEVIEQEVQMAAYEEALARRENLAAWGRLMVLLVIALALGGFTVWALMR